MHHGVLLHVAKCTALASRYDQHCQYREMVEILGDGACSGKHGNAAVLELGLAQPVSL